ncbi:MAG: Trm112 family protein [Armatimonadetes bacterium]|nr:Trm112 family protein [Armatimonadota bacterium]
MTQQIDPRLLEILACPDCLGTVRQECDWIVCEKCGRRYPIRDGIPIMLIEESVKPSAQEAGEPTGAE